MANLIEVQQRALSLQGSGERAMYNWLKNQPEFKNKIITQSYLKSIVLLGTSSNIQIPILADSGGNTILGEKRLERSDAFWSMAHGIFIAKVDTGGSPAQSIASLQEQTFSNPLVFTNAAEQLALQTLYNGELNVNIARIDVLKGVDLKRFRRVDVAQKGLEVSTSTNNAYQASSWDANEGLYPLTPHLLYTGQSTPKVSIDLPESVAMGGTGTTTNYIVYVNRGFYIADGANLGGQS